MLTTAEVRWFWPARCPQLVRDWFFKTGLPPGGGLSRVDRYARHRSEPEISLKKRGRNPDFEVKGLVTTRVIPELEPLAERVEIWCKWSCAIPGLNLVDEVTVTKTRCLRTFDTLKHVRSEIPLDANEKPSAGYSMPVEGCNIELTDAQIVGRSGVWGTLGFEAFGDLDRVPTNLTLTILPEMPGLARVVASGAFLNYPAWLLAKQVN